MQKKIIALAIAGLASSAAFAQTNVTVYGLIDQAYVYSKSDNGLTGANAGDYKVSGIKDGGLNGSRFGFKGEEALGNGLKAIFTMEIGKDADNETNVANFTNRQSFVGLNGNWGTATVGRQYNAASMFYSKNTSNDVTGVMPVNSLQNQNGSQIRSGGGNARQDNVIKYVSPNMSGFTVAASYAFGENYNTLQTGKVKTVYDSVSNTYDPAADVTDNGRYSIAGDYTNGPFNVSAAYAVTTDVYNSTSGTVGYGKDIKEWFVGAGYDFKVVKVTALYQDLSNDNNATSVVTDQNLWAVGLSAPIGAKGLAYIEYAEFDGKTGNQAAKNDGKSKGWGIGYQHSLSKRTTLYTQFSQIDHDSDVASVGSWVAGAAAKGEKQDNFVAGIRHTF
ncbi:MAG: porin [Propionivibrio sp.]